MIDSMNYPAQQEREAPEPSDCLPLRRGRPRRLQISQVVEAALAVGPTRLTMGAVAEHLGVAKAVLYNYVGSRQELVQLATAQAARQHQFPEDCGQPWPIWVLEYARALFEWVTLEGELFAAWISGGHSPVVEVDSAELWLRVLTDRGFSGEEALQLRRAVGQIVIGAAVNFRHDRALAGTGQARPESATKAVLNRPLEETLLLRQFLDLFAREADETSWEHTLFLLLRGVMVARDALVKSLEGDSPPFEQIRL